MAITSRHIGNRDLQTIGHQHRCILWAFSAKCTLVIATPGVYFSMIRECHGVHAAAYYFQDAACRVQALIKKWNFSRLLDFKWLIIAESYIIYYDIVS
jgi:hypothetical protein